MRGASQARERARAKAYAPDIRARKNTVIDAAAKHAARTIASWALGIEAVTRACARESEVDVRVQKQQRVGARH